jgi:hypothetical protein
VGSGDGYQYGCRRCIADAKQTANELLEQFGCLMHHILRSPDTIIMAALVPTETMLAALQCFCRGDIPPPAGARTTNVHTFARTTDKQSIGGS